MKKWIVLYLFFAALELACIVLTVWALFKTPLKPVMPHFILRVAAHCFIAENFKLLRGSIKGIREYYADVKIDSAHK